MADAPSPDPKLLTFSDYARRLGVTQQRVSQMVAAARIPVVETIPGDVRSRRIDPDAADAALRDGESPASRMKPAAPHRAPAAPAPSASSTTARPPLSNAPAIGAFATARAASEATRAKMLDVEYRRRIGELVEVDRVRRAVQDVAIAATKILDAFPDRYAGPFAAESDVRKLRAALLDAVDDVKRRIADGTAALTEARSTETLQ